MFDRACCHWWLRLLDTRLILRGTCRATGICWVICSFIHCFEFSYDPQKKTQNNGCNCKSPNKCPLPSKCLAKSIVYQATVTTNDNKPDQTYIGLTSNTFKTRFANHKTSFTNVKKKHATELSKHVWQLKDKYIDYKIKWEIIKQASPYNNTSNRCNLCLWEKYFIICHPSLATLNKRNELVSSCRHANKYLLRNFVT